MLEFGKKTSEKLVLFGKMAASWYTHPHMEFFNKFKNRQETFLERNINNYARLGKKFEGKNNLSAGLDLPQVDVVYIALHCAHKIASIDLMDMQSDINPEWDLMDQSLDIMEQRKTIAVFEDLMKRHLLENAYSDDDRERAHRATDAVNVLIAGIPREKDLARFEVSEKAKLDWRIRFRPSFVAMASRTKK